MLDSDENDKGGGERRLDKNEAGNEVLGEENFRSELILFQIELDWGGERWKLKGMNTYTDNPESDLSRQRVMKASSKHS